MPDTLETSQHFIFVCVIFHPFLRQKIALNSPQGLKSTFVVRPLQFAVGPPPRLTHTFDFLKQCVSKDINQTVDNIDVDLA